MRQFFRWLKKQWDKLPRGRDLPLYVNRQYGKWKVDYNGFYSQPFYYDVAKAYCEINGKPCKIVYIPELEREQEAKNHEE